MARKNPINDAYERELADAVDPELDLDDEADYNVESFSDEDVIAAVKRTDAATRTTIEASRRRGAQPARGHAGHKSVAQQEVRARDPVRERQATWAPADTLLAPKAKPGMEQRWIRVRLGEKDDPTNIAKKLSQREGWSPVRLEDVTDNYSVPSVAFGNLGSVIGVSDLILCERPIEVGISRAKYMAAKLARQLASADKRHIKAVETDDHRIMGGAKEDMAPTVGRGTRRRPEAQED